MKTSTSENANRKAPGSWRGLNLAEALVIVAILGLLAALFLPDSATRTRWEIERRAREWEPSSADQRQPDPSFMAANVSIVGEWAVCRHRNGSSMTISENSPGKFTVLFSTYGCMGRCDFQRDARFDNGILTFDRPVSEYFPVAYDTLYAVRVAGDDLLLPAAFVTKFQHGLSDDGKQIADDLIVRMYVYRRAAAFEDKDSGT